MTNIFDEPKFYQIIGSFILGVQIFVSFTTLLPDSNPVFPNLLVFLSINLVCLLFMICSRILDPKESDFTQSFKNLIYLSVPPIFGFIVSRRFIQNEKKERNDNVIIIGGYMILIAFLLISVVYIPLLLLLYVSANSQLIVFYLLILGPLSYFGFLLGENNVFYTPHVRFNPELKDTWGERFRNNTSRLVLSLFYTTRRRIILTTILSIYFVIIIMLQSNEILIPIYY